MTVYTAEEAGTHLTAVLAAARGPGGVRIRASDGQEYEVRAVAASPSPFDVQGVNLQLSASEIVSFVRESREK